MHGERRAQARKSSASSVLDWDSSARIADQLQLDADPAKQASSSSERVEEGSQVGVPCLESL